MAEVSELCCDRGVTEVSEVCCAWNPSSTKVGTVPCGTRARPRLALCPVEPELGQGWHRDPWNRARSRLAPVWHRALWN